MKTEEVEQQVPTSDGVSARVRAAWDGAASITRRALVAALFTSAVISGASQDTSAERIALAVSGCCFVAAALVDTHERRLPNRLLGIAALSLPFVAVAQGAPWGAVRGVVGALVAGGAMLIVRLARGVGMGDVKMAAAIGLSLGRLHPIAPPVAIAVASLVAAAYGVATGRSRLVLGPSLWFGWATAIAAVSRWR